MSCLETVFCVSWSDLRAQVYFVSDTRSPLRSRSAASRSTLRSRPSVYWNVRSVLTAHPVFCPLRSALTLRCIYGILGASATKTQPTKSSLKAAQIDPSTFEELTANRGRCRRTIRLGCQRIEEDRICPQRTTTYKEGRNVRERHQQHSPPPDSGRHCRRISLWSMWKKLSLTPKLDYSATQDGTPRRRNNEDGSVVLDGQTDDDQVRHHWALTCGTNDRATNTKC